MTTFGGDAATFPTIFRGVVAGGTAVTFWTAITGGTQVTNLTKGVTTGLSSITSNADGSMPEFTDPAGHTFLWADAGGAERVKIFPDPAKTYPAVILPEAYGAVGDGTTDDCVALQAAINAQQTTGGEIVLGAGKTYLVTASQLIPAIGTTSPWTNATRPLRIRGAGMRSSVIKAGSQFQAGGIFGYGSGGSNPVIAQLVFTDFTLDGNYSGSGGSIAQPATLPGALVAAPWPFTAVSSTSFNGKYHLFERVHFYRPTGYGFQPTQGVKLIGCTFDNCGQPAAGSTHYDNLGSGDGDAIVIGCNWVDSTGNYVDFVTGSGGFIRVIFTGNVSKNHTLGGLYGAGLGSVITGNRLENSSAGGGIGYDGGTHSTVRAANIVANNMLTNMTVRATLSAASYGDIVFNNIASDSGGSGAPAFCPVTTTTAPSAGGAGALPATPTGYMTIEVNGTARKVAYY